ncbi:hypothetical protein FRB99_005936 [Tulasnella sp. 403]|nr:hypothetical protein FRB99_005936 [Tulasnella sp. 403]
MSAESSEILPPMDVIYPNNPYHGNPPESYDVSAGDEPTSPLYESHGKLVCLRSVTLQNPIRITQLSASENCNVYLESVEYNGNSIGIISKYWDIRNEWHGFYSELFLYASEAHLRPFQGSSIPRVLGVYATQQGHLNVVLELPHTSTSGWTEADPAHTPDRTKEKFVRAYEQIHAAGVLHGGVELRNMLFTDDEHICITDWQNARSLHPNSDVALQACSQAEVDWEIRRVQYLLDFDGARTKERQLWNETDKQLFDVYSRIRSLRNNDQSVAEGLADEEWSEETGTWVRVDPRSDTWFDDMDAQTGGNRLDIANAPDARPASPKAPLMLPIFSSPSSASDLPSTSAPAQLAFVDAPLTPPLPQVGGEEEPQQPSPPPTPPSRRQQIVELRNSLAALDAQIARLQTQKDAIAQTLQALEGKRTLPPVTSPLREGNDATNDVRKARRVRKRPSRSSTDLSTSEEASITKRSPGVGRKRKAGAREDDEPVQDVPDPKRLRR